MTPAASPVPSSRTVDGGSCSPSTVIPAKAGIQLSVAAMKESGIPAYAGMTKTITAVGDH
jgi:hypothetical protein